MEFKGLITLTRVNDGASGDGSAQQYFVETNAQDLYYFYDSQSKRGNVSTFEISLYRLPKSDFSIIALNQSNCVLTNDANIDISSMYRFGQQAQEEGETVTIRQETLFFSFEDFLKTEGLPENVVFTFIYTDGETQVIQSFACRPGASTELAKFNVTATNINASVGSSLLAFERSGLNIYGAGLSIYNNGSDSKEKVLYVDETGNLRLKGHIEAYSGKFKGEIEATNASFQKGTIGGFNIAEDGLVSSNQTLKLFGKDGTIYAKNITLGEQANIENFIKLGNAYLYNPANNSNKLIESSSMIIYDNGIAKIGKINMDGNSSTISGDNWSINADRANFNNISISGTIDTTVFNTSSVQAVGGTMMFMPSYKILWLNGKEATFEEDMSSIIKKGDSVWAVKNNVYQVLTVDSVNDTKVTFLENINNDSVAIIVIGKIGDLIVGINGSHASVANGLLRPKGLTLTKYSNETAILPNLFLGDLEQLNIRDVSGFGLYSDTVYLNGSLTTKTSQGSYAGVNTLTGVPATVFNSIFTDSSNIIFWAGANDSSSTSIQAAPFQVTEGGSVYASKAYLTDSLMVGGEIKGTDIYAARIHGWDNSKGSIAGLSIYDLDKGISFRTGYKESDNEIFSIGINGFSTSSDENFIAITNNGRKVDFSGNSFKAKINENNYLALIAAVESNSLALYHKTSQDSYCGFYFEDGKTTYRMGYKENNQNTEKSKILIEKTKIGLEGTISFSEQMEYRKTDSGYDLYVIE